MVGGREICHQLFLSHPIHCLNKKQASLFCFYNEFTLSSGTIKKRRNRERGNKKIYNRASHLRHTHTCPASCPLPRSGYAPSNNTDRRMATCTKQTATMGNHRRYNIPSPNIHGAVFVASDSTIQSIPHKRQQAYRPHGRVRHRLQLYGTTIQKGHIH